VARIATRRATPIRVLLVEDRPVARKMLADELAAVEGIEVPYLARDADEAVRLVREKRPDIVLLDLVLPGRDGIETIKEIRTFSDVPIVLLTGANVAPESLEHVAKRQGADAFIRKPSGPVSFDMYRITGRLVAEIERLVAIHGEPEGEPERFLPRSEHSRPNS
jgi:CheY-like chemotaxis protein